MADNAQIEYGGEVMTRDEATTRLVATMLQRLPQSLWDQDPQTVQGQLYAVVAAELTTWLDAWSVTRNATLLQRAEGVDLDTLLEDYGIKRYNQRPDAYARQIARHVLFSPKGTLFGLQDLGQLCTDYLQLVARSGRQQPHYWISASHPLILRRTYWQLADHAGRMWYLTMGHNEMVLSRSPAPGANITPLPDGWAVDVPGTPDWLTWGTAPAYATGRGDVQPLRWFTARDVTQGLWYVTIDAGGTFGVSQTPPTGLGTTQPLELLDGHGGIWRVQVEPPSQALRPIELAQAAAAPTYWRMVDTDGEPCWLMVDDEVPAIRRGPPPWIDTTPTVEPLAWFLVTNILGTTRYAVVTPLEEFQLLEDQPAGNGTTDLPVLIDVHAHHWALRLEQTLITMALTPVIPEAPSTTIVTLLNPGYTGQYVVLTDATPQPWSVWIEHAELAVFDGLEVGLEDVTPEGEPYAWLRLTDLRRARHALRPDGVSALEVTQLQPDGQGTMQPTSLNDDDGTRWHVGVGLDGSAAISDTPPVIWDQAGTCLVLNDTNGGRWFWRMEPRSGELVTCDVLEPDTILYMPEGEVGSLRGVDIEGHALQMTPTTWGEVKVQHATQLDHPWSLPTIETPLRDPFNRDWLLRFGLRMCIAPTEQWLDDVPLSDAPIYVRDLEEAFTHVAAAGALMTFWVT